MGSTNLCPIIWPHKFPTWWPSDHPPPDLTAITHIALAQCVTFNDPRARDMGSFTQCPFAYVSASSIDHVSPTKYCQTPISSVMASKTTSPPKSKPSLFIKHFFPVIFHLVVVKSLLSPIFTLFHPNRIVKPLRNLCILNSCYQLSTIKSFRRHHCTAS